MCSFHLCDVNAHPHRDYLANRVADFAQSNPKLTVYVRQRPGRHPRIVAEFCELFPIPHLCICVFAMRMYLSCIVVQCNEIVGKPKV